MENNWKNPKSNKLFEAFLKLKSKEEVAAFCRDLMTEDEIEEFAGRFEVALLLEKGLPQREVSKKSGVSIATVTRVNKWLNRGMNGYKTVISRFNHQHPRSRGK